MNIQLATVCDFAADYNGKLCIQGAFDTLCASDLSGGPSAVLHRCAGRFHAGRRWQA
jgi:hypothetical protein